MKHKGVSHDDLHRLWGESERKRRQWGGGRDSFRISKCLLGSACAFSLGGREGGKKGKEEGGDNVRMEKKMRGQERGS